MGDASESPSHEPAVHRLQIVGLPADLGDAELERRFQSFGAEVSSEVIRSEDGACRGFGYVSIRAPEADVARCIRTYTGVRWRGQTMAVAYAHAHYLERLQQEWDGAAAGRAASAAAAASRPPPPAVDPTAMLRVRASWDAPIVKVFPGVTNRHKRSFVKLKALTPKAQPYPDGSDSEGEGATAEGARPGITFLSSPGVALAEVGNVFRPKERAAPALPTPRSTPVGLEAELEEAEQFMREQVELLVAIQCTIVLLYYTISILLVGGGGAVSARTGRAARRVQCTLVLV